MFFILYIIKNLNNVIFSLHQFKAKMYLFFISMKNVSHVTSCYITQDNFVNSK